jgi:HD-GYP domain-containing protein (c-di-GMP phosphodiesterase class II)
MPYDDAHALEAAGFQAGTEVVRYAPHVRESVRTLVAAEEIEQVDLLLRVMAGFDAASAEHLEAVGTMAMLLADHCKFAPQIVSTSLLAGRLHDIGKLAISRTLLLKPGPPTPAEWEELKLHPIHGGATLAGLPRLKRLAPCIIAHHERVDGRGYPYGLGGDEIPIESQIVAIAEAFCAMTVPRPYAPTLLPGDALAELERCAGTQFTAELVDGFVDMFRSGRSVTIESPR